MKPRFSKQLFLNPYLLLTLCVLFWSGNFVIGRAVSGEMPPIAFSFWRWAIASLILLPWVIKPLKRNLPILKANIGRMTIMALLGVTAFNTLVYLGLQNTTAINALLMQSLMPLVIIGLNWLIYRKVARPIEALSIAISLCGVLLIISAGNPLLLLEGNWNQGDLWILVAVLTWALYSVWLKWRPAELEPLAFLGYTLFVGTLMILPLYLWELSTEVEFVAAPSNFMAIIYVALFPSVLSYLFWNKSVGIVGANRAGHFSHLIPVFGSISAVLFLGETFAWYHAVGASLVGTAIGITLLARQS